MDHRLTSLLQKPSSGVLGRDAVDEVLRCTIALGVVTGVKYELSGSLGECRQILIWNPGLFLKALSREAIDFQIFRRFTKNERDRCPKARFSATFGDQKNIGDLVAS